MVSRSKSSDTGNPSDIHSKFLSLVPLKIWKHLKAGWYIK